MTNQDRELLERALKGLEAAYEGQIWLSHLPDLITALRERLAREEQEPVKESSITHSHLWVSDLYGKEKNA